MHAPDPEPAAPTRRAALSWAFVAGAVVGLLAGGGDAWLSAHLESSPTMRLPARMVWRGQVPEATSWSVREAARARQETDRGAYWPPSPVRLPDRPAVADEGTFTALPVGAPVALTWLRLPTLPDETVRVLGWRPDDLELGPWNGDPAGVVAWLAAPPPGDVLDEALATIGVDAAAHERPPPGTGGHAVGLCRLDPGLAVLVHGTVADARALVGLLDDIGCATAGAVWRTTAPGLQLGTPAGDAADRLWVLRASDPGGRTVAFAP